MHGEPSTVGVHKKANSTSDIIGGMIVGGERGRRLITKSAGNRFPRIDTI
jgi:hypothetical protein